MLNAFPIMWQMLSPAGVAERRLNRLLNVGEDRALPQKMAALLANYPKYRYPSELQNSLRTLAELLLVDLEDRKGSDQLETKRQFYEECYCESGALSQHALVSKRMLAARYTSLFNQSEEAPNVEPVQKRRDKHLFTSSIITEAISQRPIVLIPDYSWNMLVRASNPAFFVRSEPGFLLKLCRFD